MNLSAYAQNHEHICWW